VNTLASRIDPNEFPIRSIAVIGLGLLGGSVARAIRHRDADCEIRLIGYARRKETRDFALEQGGFDAVTDDFLAAAKQTDLVVIATPVDRIAEYAVKIAAACPHVLMTDVGSTKFGIVESVGKNPEAAARFVAAHPIAGSEKTGIEHAHANLFDGKPIVITPSEKERPGAVDAVHRFWESTGGRVIRMTPRRHDDLLAMTSHMPHLMSALVAKQLPDEAISMVGTGWLDTTRIAAGDEKLWTAIVSENRPAILASLQSAAADLTHLIDIVQNADDESLHEYLRIARDKRTAIPS